MGDKSEKLDQSSFKDAESLYRIVVESTTDLFFVTDELGEFTYISPNIQAVLGYELAEVREMNNISRLLGENLFSGQGFGRTERAICDKQGEEHILAIQISKEAIGPSTIFYACRDITRERELEKALQRIEQDLATRKGETPGENENQLWQSQKMEAVGQLAGGVAHDFNNLLQAIGGNVDMALASLPEQVPFIRDCLDEIRTATDRAAALTRQLLTFSRRETLHPKLLDLNRVIEDMMKLLRRVLGEHIELTVEPQAGLDAVFADYGQIEQIIVNLCINARDAMPRGGRLCIETDNVVLDETFCRQHPEALPGPYILLTVSDTGNGMSEEVLRRACEPFFTTKEVGQGTGLGLFTVYAIVQRHDGFLLLDSTLGMGSTLCIYLPASGPSPGEEVEISYSFDELQGTETVLYAEDDEPVRNIGTLVLEQAGYRLLVAGDGQEAIDLIQSRGADIELAILDVIMPKLGGGEVCKSLRTVRPDCPVLFSSGYSHDSLSDDQLPGDCELIQKPYTPNDLLRKIREMLDR